MDRSPTPPRATIKGPTFSRYRARDNGTPPLKAAWSNVTLNVGSANDPPRLRPAPGAAEPNRDRECGVDAAFTRTVLRRPGSVAADDHRHWIAGRPQCHTRRRDSGYSGRSTSTGTFTVNVTVSDGQSQFPSTFTMVVLAAGRTDLALSAAAAPSPAVINQQSLGRSRSTTAPLSRPWPICRCRSCSRARLIRQPLPAPGCTAAPQADGTTVALRGRARASRRAALRSPWPDGSSAQPGDVVATATVAITDGVPIDATPSNDTAHRGQLRAVASRRGRRRRCPPRGLRASASGDFNGDGFIDLALRLKAARYADLSERRRHGHARRTKRALGRSTHFARRSRREHRHRRSPISTATAPSISSSPKLPDRVSHAEQSE